MEDNIATSTINPYHASQRAQRKALALPTRLPRVDRVIEPDSIACPCARGEIPPIGEDRTELDAPRRCQS